MRERSMYAPSLAAIVLTGCISVSAQVAPKSPSPQNPQGEPQPPAAACPRLEMRSPTPQYVRDGTPIKFAATLSTGDMRNVTFNWSTSSGTITSGQGTPNIDVDSTGAGADKAVTATLLVGGLAAECTAFAEFTVKVAGPAKKVHEYGTVPDEQQEKWLESLVNGIGPDEVAYVIVYAGKNNAIRGATYNELKKIRTQALKGGNPPSSRLVTVDGGFKEEPWHEFWVVPMGADAPKPSPTINSKDIVFIKPPVTAKKPQ